MLHSVKTAICAAVVSCLAGVFASASAQAALFEFSFGTGVNGTFTTGAPSTEDPGFDLITGLTFDLLSGTAAAPFSFTDLVASDFQPGAAFNPTTAAFVNHFNGDTFPDIGGFKLPNFDSIDSSSFSQNSPLFSGLLSDIPFFVEARLVITEAPAVPEPSTWAMMLAGFGGLGWLAHMRRRKMSPA